jgi:hypothetical protein
MIKADLAGGAAAVDRLRTMRNEAVDGVARAIARLGIDLQSNVRQNKLSGQVLQVRSGALRDSVAVRIEPSGTAVTASVYSDLDYAAAQEYGFFGTVGVRASLRQIKEAFGHPIAPKTIGVGAYARRMDLPQRSFLRSALDDMAPEIEGEIAGVLREALSR